MQSLLYISMILIITAHFSVPEYRPFKSSITCSWLKYLLVTLLWVMGIVKTKTQVLKYLQCPAWEISHQTNRTSENWYTGTLVVSCCFSLAHWWFLVVFAIQASVIKLQTHLFLSARCVDFQVKVLRYL